eukprot:CAMPEP_0172207986 /NCGR_PEP_ID=MMETSP1050-20130122/34176_1 /TAXON_ID=233186 /ORGANISM="Cryptomonas curvata, Strain CCAP979/52" /LENGTH=52 /DNA_ID=CAMNT_0012887437 /DNA_START=15 /DNA_END=169 /DNA_ORIENTATION=+
MEKVLEIELKSLATLSVASTLSNIAGVYNSQGKFKEALENMEKVLEIELKSL